MPPPAVRTRAISLVRLPFDTTDIGKTGFGGSALQLLAPSFSSNALLVLLTVVDLSAHIIPRVVKAAPGMTGFGSRSRSVARFLRAPAAPSRSSPCARSSLFAVGCSAPPLRFPARPAAPTRVVVRRVGVRRRAWGVWPACSKYPSITLTLSPALALALAPIKALPITPALALALVTRLPYLTPV